MKNNGAVTQVENLYPENVRLISTTDLKGRITSVNQDFVDVCGYSAEELLGASHNIVRHPDMPPAAFADLWQHLKADKPWMGLVKNRCKNGDHYWVNAYVTPVFEGGKKVGYQSVRTKPQRDYVDNAARLYRQINAGKAPSAKPFRDLHKQLLSQFAVLLLPAVGVSAVSGFSAATVTAGVVCAAVGTGVLNLLQKSRGQRIEQRAVAAYNSPLACLAYLGETHTDAKTENALQDIAATIANVNDMNTQIATATEEQSAVTEEINRNVANINAATDDINQASQAAANAGEELVGVAADMESVVSQFRHN